MRIGPVGPVVLLTALLAAGCGTGGGPPPANPVGSRPAPTGSAGGLPRDAGAPRAATPSGGTATGAFSGTDVAWLQLTVAMNERLLKVLDLVPTRTTDPAWRGLAARVENVHRADLSRSRRLLVGSGAPATNPHEGHDMPGMVTAEDLAALRAASGPSFHRLVARHLRAHLTQAVRVAEAERRGGVNPATTALAAAVVRSGTAELARLDRLAAPSPAGTAP
ncbi:DUF305 domain-containing protein [Micromonospora sp. URMC 103]|uniref:DUF305 domain-containing protein n=1 Tax=Micromonospora sp. URMC 103 TaxID=3423406 RepID=UPI003F1934F4